MAAISIEVGSISGLELINKKKHLQAIASQDNKILEKLVLMSKSKKAIDYLTNKWTMLQGFLSI